MLLAAHWFGYELLVIDSEILALFENKNNDIYDTATYRNQHFYYRDVVKIYFSLKLD